MLIATPEQCEQAARFFIRNPNIIAHIERFIATYPNRHAAEIEQSETLEVIEQLVNVEGAVKLANDLKNTFEILLASVITQEKNVTWADPKLKGIPKSGSGFALGRAGETKIALPDRPA